MTCAACGFENMEEQTACFRCGRDLSLDRVEIEPPRRPRGGLGWLSQDLWLFWNRQQHAQRLISPVIGMGLFVLSLVPGLGHLAGGEPRRGLLAGGIWLAVLGINFLVEFPGLHRLGEWLQIYHWLPGMVHMTIMVDAYRIGRSFNRRRVPLWELVVVGFAAWLLLDLSLGRAGLAARMNDYAIQGQMVDPNLQTGDMAQVWPTTARVAKGAVVRYRVPGYAFDLLGTIQAGPGATLAWRKGRLLIDGETVPIPGGLTQERALGPLGDHEISVPPNYFLIVPPEYIASRTRKLEELLVPRGAITGTVVRIVAPPARSRRLD